VTEPQPPGPDGHLDPDGHLESNGHLDLDGLADHLAGEVDAGLHLTTCGGCTARLAELEAAEHLVLAALRSIDDPPLPAAVADPLMAAVAAEPPLVEPTATSPAAPAPVPASRGATVVALEERRGRRAWMPAAAAGVVLAAGGLLGYAVVSGSQDGDSSESATAGRVGDAPAAEARGAFPTLASGLDYADPTALTAALPSVLDGSARQDSAQDQPLADAQLPGSPLPDTQLPATPQPAGSVPAGDPSALTAPAADPLARLRDPVALADCLAVVLDPADPSQQPLALDYATYRGQPALAVVLPDPDPARLSVFVVGPACSRADDDLQFFTRVTRP